MVNVGILCSRYYGYYILPTHLSCFIISCSNIIDVCNYLSCTSTNVLVCFVNGSYWLVFLPSFLVLSVNPTLMSRLTEVWMWLSHSTCSFLIGSCFDVWRVVASHAYSLTEALPDTPTSWWKYWWTRLLFDGTLFSWRRYFLHLSVLTCLTWRSDVFVELLLFCILFKFYVLLYVSFVSLNYLNQCTFVCLLTSFTLLWVGNTSVSQL